MSSPGLDLGDLVPHTVRHTQNTWGIITASEGEEDSVCPPTDETLLLPTVGVADCGLDPGALGRLAI